MTDKCIFTRFVAAARNPIFSRKFALLFDALGPVASFATRVIAMLCLTVSLSAVGSLSAQTVAEPENAKAAPTFDEDESFAHLENVCAFGRRFSTSRGMTQQQDYVRKHFESLGVQVLSLIHI